MKLFLDLDRTLFKTSDFDEQRWQLLEQWFPDVISAEKERPRQYEFFMHSDSLYAYDFTSHMDSLGLNAAIIMDRLRGSVLADGRLEYDGVFDLIDWAKRQERVAILTYGPDDYQRLKADLCPSLAGVEIITTPRHKANFFRENSPTGSVWMVDDKPIGKDLPSDVNFIQVTEYNGISAPPEADWPVVARLSELKQLVQN